MGFKVSSTGLLMSTLAFTSLFGVRPAPAYGDETAFDAFYCDIRNYETADGPQLTVPATVGATASGREVVIYYWVRDYYTETAETSLAICDRVSTLFDTLNSQGSLSAITQGVTADGSQAICSNSSCSRPIIVLLPEEKPTPVLQDLTLVLTDSDEARSYIPPVNQSDSAIQINGGGAR